jgi:site-specific DNA-methyltransferase (cytosine-N4-specific)
VLLPLLKRYAGANESKLTKAIAKRFFSETTTPEEMAKNTIRSLRAYGILSRDSSLTGFGQELIGSLQHKPSTADGLVAKRILHHLDGIPFIETMREMAKAGIRIQIKKSLPDELIKRGIQASHTSSDISGVLHWLRKAGVLSGYRIEEDRFAELSGIRSNTVAALKQFTAEQIAFLRAILALNITGWYPWGKICDHAVLLYPGEINYDRSHVPSRIIRPLCTAGLLNFRKYPPGTRRVRPGRGGKQGFVKPTAKFEAEIADEVLRSLYAAAGYAQVRQIRQKPLGVIVKEIERSRDRNKRGRALEVLAIRFCQALDLDFMAWRETDEHLAGGGEVDALFHAIRLVYSRWQVQCKVGRVDTQAISKEVGMREVTLADVILIVGTQPATSNAQTFKRNMVAKSSLNIIILDGPLLARIVDDPSQLGEILKAQAREALNCKPAVTALRVGETATTIR